MLDDLPVHGRHPEGIYTERYQHILCRIKILVRAVLQTETN